jgi:hypothetical protein
MLPYFDKSLVQGIYPVRPSLVPFLVSALSCPSSICTQPYLAPNLSAPNSPFRPRFPIARDKLYLYYLSKGELTQTMSKCNIIFSRIFLITAISIAFISCPWLSISSRSSAFTIFTLLADIGILLFCMYKSNSSYKHQLRHLTTDCLTVLLALCLITTLATSYDFFTLYYMFYQLEALLLVFLWIVSYTQYRKQLQ